MLSYYVKPRMSLFSEPSRAFLGGERRAFRSSSHLHRKTPKFLNQGALLNLCGFEGFIVT